MCILQVTNKETHGYFPTAHMRRARVVSTGTNRKESEWLDRRRCLAELPAWNSNSPPTSMPHWEP